MTGRRSLMMTACEWMKYCDDAVHHEAEMKGLFVPADDRSRLGELIGWTPDSGKKVVGHHQLQTEGLVVPADDWGRFEELIV